MAVDSHAQLVGLAHVQHASVGIKQVVEPRRFHVALELLAELVLTSRRGLLEVDALDVLLAVFLEQNLQQLHGGTGVAVGAVLAGVRNIQFRTQRTQSVGGHSRQKLFGERNRVQHHPLVVVSKTGEFLAQNSVVEWSIVRHKHRSLGHLHNSFGDLVKARSRAHILLANSRELLDKGRNRNLRAHQ